MAPDIEQLLQRVLDDIDQNIRAPLTPRELAEHAGFSLYHFYRLFEAATGMSVQRYITRRRLLFAAYDMAQGKDVITCALEYGFNTHAGFYKAFRRCFGCGPKAWLASHQASRPVRVNLKEVIPMIDPQKLSPALYSWGLADKPISNECYPNTGHMAEHTFAVGSAHMLKIFSGLGEMHRQLHLHQALYSQGLAPRIIPTLDGQEHLSYDGLDLLLTERMTGQAADALQLLQSAESCAAIGNGLARLHQALQACPNTLCEEENMLHTLMGWAIPKAAEAMPLDPAWLQAYEARIGHLFPRLPVQIIHRDPNPDNIIMQDGHVTGFMNFELSRIAPRIFDLAYAATALLSVTLAKSPNAAEQFFPAALAIWQGYHAASPLSAVEQLALPDMVIAIQMICVAAFADSDTLAALEKTNQNMLRLILNKVELLTFCSKNA